MINALSEGGILVVDLLGIYDEWVIREPTKFIGFTYQDIADLFLCDFNLLFHKEINENLPLLEGYIKTWHLHMLILQKLILNIENPEPVCTDSGFIRLKAYSAAICSIFALTLSN